MVYSIARIELVGSAARVVWVVRFLSISETPQAPPPPLAKGLAKVCAQQVLRNVVDVAVQSVLFCGLLEVIAQILAQESCD
mmetsp:Transcript_6254/g.11129  ORF Transcript_6254/g.11129 Transcript_6254/m.11129 type:complete len:81 (-) Transcript_6254:601-843(-)